MTNTITQTMVSSYKGEMWGEVTSRSVVLSSTILLSWFLLNHHNGFSSRNFQNKVNHVQNWFVCLLKTHKPNKAYF